MTNSGNDFPLFLTRADVAKMFRLTCRSVDRLVKSNKLAKFKVSPGRSAISGASVKAYLADQGCDMPFSVVTGLTPDKVPSKAPPALTTSSASAFGCDTAVNLLLDGNPIGQLRGHHSCESTVVDLAGNGSYAGTIRGTYGSRSRMLVVRGCWILGEFGGAIEDWLLKCGLPGINIIAGGNVVALSWPINLGYSVEQVRSAFDTVQVEISLAA